MPSHVIDSIRGEYLRYRALAEAALRQVEDADLSRAGPNDGNSLAVICWHVAGNLRSRFTGLLTSDGEKPWRRRDEEFAARTVSRAELEATWQQGWDALLGALAGLTDDHLDRIVTIRGQPLRVDEALHRSLSHTAYHVGQIVYLAKVFRGGEWEWLSIPPGQSTAYNREPRPEGATAQAAALQKGAGGSPAGRERHPIGYWLRRADELLTRRIDEAQRANGITRLEWQALSAISGSHGGGRDEVVNALGPFAGVEDVDALLLRLETRGLVQAAGDDTLHLTPAGTDLHERALSAQNALRRRSMAGITDAEYATVIGVLERLVNNLEAGDAP